jgi:hypothetical protein
MPQQSTRAARLQRPVPALMWMLALALALAAVTAARADDRADLERTRIVGNRELPKVLYIVPWKKPQPGELTGRPLQSILDESMAPLDRDVFRRQVRYDAQLAAPAAPAAANAAAPASAAPAQQGIQQGK